MTGRALAGEVVASLHRVLPAGDGPTVLDDADGGWRFVIAAPPRPWRPRQVFVLRFALSAVNPAREEVQAGAPVSTILCDMLVITGKRRLVRRPGTVEVRPSGRDAFAFSVVLTPGDPTGLERRLGLREVTETDVRVLAGQLGRAGPPPGGDGPINLAIIL